jgi:hypothetical protein
VSPLLLRAEVKKDTKRIAAVLGIQILTNQLKGVETNIRKFDAPTAAPQGSGR